MPVTIYRAAQRERAAAAYLSTVDKALRKAVTDASKEHILPWARSEAQRWASTPVQSRIAASARWSPYKGTPGVAFGGARAVTSTGVPGRVLARPLEFGSDGRRWRDYIERRRGGQVSVLRRTSRQFMPEAPEGGRFIGPAMEGITDDVLRLWVSVTEDTVLAAFDGMGD